MPCLSFVGLGVTLLHVATLSGVHGQSRLDCLCGDGNRGIARRRLQSAADSTDGVLGSRQLLQRFNEESRDCNDRPPPPPPTPSQRQAAARRAAAARQKSAAKAIAKQLADESNGVVLTPGPRGTLGHSRRCAVAQDDRVRQLLVDESNRLWSKTKQLWVIASKLIFNSDDTASLLEVRAIERECLALGSRFQRINLIERLGGGQIEDIFKEACDLEGHLEGLGESAFLEIVKFLYNTPAGEYVSLVINRVLKGRWPNSVDYCGLVCRKNHRGLPLQQCLVGCPEIHPSVTGCWSQCSNYTCRRACKNSFWHRKKKRRSCYRRCDAKCSYN